jgi:hypothetical protein
MRIGIASNKKPLWPFQIKPITFLSAEPRHLFTVKSGRNGADRLKTINRGLDNPFLRLKNQHQSVNTATPKTAFFWPFLEQLAH